MVEAQVDVCRRDISELLAELQVGVASLKLALLITNRPSLIN